MLQSGKVHQGKYSGIVDISIDRYNTTTAPLWTVHHFNGGLLLLLPSLVGSQKCWIEGGSRAAPRDGKKGRKEKEKGPLLAHPPLLLKHSASSLAKCITQLIGNRRTLTDTLCNCWHGKSPISTSTTSVARQAIIIFGLFFCRKADAARTTRSLLSKIPLTFSFVAKFRRK